MAINLNSPVEHLIICVANGEQLALIYMELQGRKLSGSENRRNVRRGAFAQETENTDARCDGSNLQASRRQGKWWNPSQPQWQHNPMEETRIIIGHPQEEIANTIKCLNNTKAPARLQAEIDKHGSLAFSE